MKKRTIYIIAITAIAICAITVNNARQKAIIEDLAFANIEALTAIEGAVGVTEGDFVSFTFAGKSWWGNPYSTSNFFPKYGTCQEASGQKGFQVSCTQGGGDCWNGTNCLY